MKFTLAKKGSVQSIHVGQSLNPVWRHPTTNKWVSACCLMPAQQISSTCICYQYEVNFHFWSKDLTMGQKSFGIPLVLRK
jgi:hypothetical protein